MGLILHQGCISKWGSRAKDSYFVIWRCYFYPLHPSSRLEGFHLAVWVLDGFFRFFKCSLCVKGIYSHSLPLQAF